MVSLHNASLVGAGVELQDAIWKATQSTLEAWTGQRLQGCSLYGIRVYTSNSILHTHVDRLPLVASAILNVAQDVDEPWPLEVIGHDGKAHNITMEPGDMVLYESHSILHGRPFPLKGRYFANLFVHFEPILAIADDETTKDVEDDVGEEDGLVVLPYVQRDKISAEAYRQLVEERNEHYYPRNNNKVIATTLTL
jgi:hypothetical protein